MTKLWCLDDAGGWGRQLAQEASARGWKARMFSSPTDVAGIARGDFAFMRIAQDARRGAAEKELAKFLATRGVRLIPSLREILLYEDKAEQAIEYAQWMPDTAYVKSRMTAEYALQQMQFPFLSKSRTGSASRNVRMVNTLQDARREIDAAFGEGIAGAHKLGEAVQRGYLLWQDFLTGNAYDYRIVRTGRHMMALKRFNKPGTPFASGSGINSPAPDGGELLNVLRFADSFFSSIGSIWCGIDVVHDNRRGVWRVLETTLGWTASAYAQCRYYLTTPTGIPVASPYRGAEVWRLLCDEIEKGYV